MANENWNPNNRGLQNVPIEVTAIANSQSGIVAVATKLRNVRKAHAEFDDTGGASGRADVNAIAKSGNIVEVQFTSQSGSANQSGFASRGVPPNSGYGYSGGTLTVWADGD